MASPGNRHCASCIDTLSFPTLQTTVRINRVAVPIPILCLAYPLLYAHNKQTTLILGQMCSVTYFFTGWFTPWSPWITASQKLLEELHYIQIGWSMTSQNLWLRYDRHFVDITWHNVCTVQLRGEDLSRYLINIQSVGLWKCLYDH